MRYLLALGSNLGDRLTHLATAIAALGEAGSVELISGVYETAPEGFVDQGPFYNMCLQFECELDPESLMLLLNDLQEALGKEVPFPNGPRIIDIDLLLADDEVCATADLTLPHPRMHERLFVLQPLAEIAPLAIHPLLNVTIENLLGRIDGGDPASRVVTPEGVMLAVERL